MSSRFCREYKLNNIKSITINIKRLLETKNLSGSRLGGLINVTDGAIYSMINGERPFPEDKIQKIAHILEVSPEMIKGWILADKYPKNILKMAVAVKQEVTPETDKSILATKVDELLKLKGLSRTGLSKVIVYNQGKLNKMIKGVEPMSPLVTSKIAPILEVSEEEITSWIVADKYSLEALQVAVGD
jgi:plasmid maintenance system antidote protein VapI